MEGRSNKQSFEKAGALVNRINEQLATKINLNISCLFQFHTDTLLSSSLAYIPINVADFLVSEWTDAREETLKINFISLLP